MQQRFFRIRDLASGRERPGRLPVSAATVWRWVRDGQFPAPVRLGPGCTAWTLEAVEAWEQSRLVDAGVAA